MQRDGGVNLWINGAGITPNVAAEIGVAIANAPSLISPFVNAYTRLNPNLIAKILPYAAALFVEFLPP